MVKLAKDNDTARSFSAQPLTIRWTAKLAAAARVPRIRCGIVLWSESRLIVILAMRILKRTRELVALLTHVANFALEQCHECVGRWSKDFLHSELVT